MTDANALVGNTNPGGKGQPQGQPQDNAGSPDDVSDVEFEEVKEDGK